MRQLESHHVQVLYVEPCCIYSSFASSVFSSISFSCVPISYIAHFSPCSTSVGSVFLSFRVSCFLLFFGLFAPVLFILLCETQQ